MGLAEVRDVERLDSHREALELEVRLKRTERLGPLLVAVLAAEAVLGERQRCVALGQLPQAAQVAAGGDADLDLRVALRGQRLLQHLGAVLQLRADDDPCRDRRRGAVVLEQEALGDLARLALLAAGEVEALALGQDPVAHLEDLGVRVGSLDHHPDQVRAAEAAARDALALHQALDRVQPVAEERRPLEVLRRGCLVHLGHQLARHLLVAAREKPDDLVDVPPVLLAVDVADARRLAALDEVVEARDPRAPPRLGALARAVLEELPEQVERLAHALRRRERPEVGAVRLVPLAGEVHAREVLVQADRDVRVRLVVAQPDVELRPVALDEALLGDQGLGLGLGDQDLDVVDSANHLAVRAPEKCDPTRLRIEFAFPT